MKNLFTKFIFSTLFCVVLLTSSCNNNSIKGIEDSENYTLLVDFYATMDSWETASLTAISTIAFSDFDYGLETNGCVDDQGDDNPILPIGRDIMDNFSSQLGFASTVELNEWYIAFGRAYYDLIIEERPSDKKLFINEVTQKIRAEHVTDCELPHEKTLARSSFDKANTFGVSIGGKINRTCEGSDLYGTHSSIHHIYNFLKEIDVCNS